MTPNLEAALDAIHAEIGPYAPEKHQLVAAKCRALVRGYDARYINAGYKPVAVEKTKTARLYNLATNGVSRTFRMAGKLDLLCEKDGQLHLFDHKTTSNDIADPDAMYWRQLVIEGQVDHYILLSFLGGEKIEKAVWDVVRKPSISPKKLSIKDRKNIGLTKEYLGQNLSDASLKHVEDNDRETLEMYEIRLTHDCVNERPDWYFQRRSVTRMQSEIEDYADELWEHTKTIQHVRRRTNEKRLPPRNSGACMLYGSACKFLGICSGHDDEHSDKWRKKERTHNELPDLDDGRDALTNSRVRCFQTCQRKHYYEYELGIERQDEEEREALFFGSLYHLALNAWWLAFGLEERETNEHCNSAPVNEVGTDAGEPTYW